MPESLITVKQAAERLKVSEPRLRRALKRTGTATLTGPYETATGTRTGTRFDVSALDSLAVYLSKERDGEQEQERDTYGNGNATERDTAPMPGEIVAELRAQIASGQNEIAFLREALQREQETARRAMDAQNALAAELAKAREQSAVLIAATAGAFNAPRITTSATEGQRTAQDAVSMPPVTSEGQNGEVVQEGSHQKQRGFLGDLWEGVQFWKQERKQ